MMFQAHARWLLLTGLSGSLLFACSDDAAPQTPSPTAGTSSTSGSSGASAQGGTSSGSGGSSSTAGTMSSSGSGGGTSAGAAGSASGSGGSAAGSGGASAGSGGAGGGGGSGGAALTAVANIVGVGGDGTGKVAGTATFTQGATMVTLVLDLTQCPNGVHSSHLHMMKECGSDGMAAGGHWPNGEMLGDYTCADGKVTKEFMRGTDKWTIGGDAATDITQHSFMVHAMGDDVGSGARIGCGPIDKK